MRPILVILFLSYGCSQVPTKPEEDTVTISAALNQSQASYLKGCVDAFISVGQKMIFLECNKRAHAHRKEIEGILSQDIKTLKNR